MVEGTYISKAGRGALDVLFASTTTLLPAPSIVPSTFLLGPLAPMGVEVIDAVVGSQLTIRLDNTLLVSRTMDTTRVTQSLGAIFTGFRTQPRRLSVLVIHPTALPGYIEFFVYTGLPAIALTNGLQTWTGILPYSWAQQPHARDIIATFTESTAGNLQVIKVPRACIAPGGNVELDHQFVDGTFGKDTASYAQTFEDDYIIFTYPNRRGHAQVRLRSVVAAAT
jgi:hypothetical protein